MTEGAVKIFVRSAVAFRDWAGSGGREMLIRFWLVFIIISSLITGIETHLLGDTAQLARHEMRTMFWNLIDSLQNWTYKIGTANKGRH